MATISKIKTHMKLLRVEFLWSPTYADASREGRCRVGSNGRAHPASHRDTGPGIQGKIRGDNVGNDHLPAGADSNLRRPANEANAEECGRDLVGRMSPYERRRRGNARRGGARHHPRHGNTGAGQRGSGHSVVPERPRTLSRDKPIHEAGTKLESKLRARGGHASQRLSLIDGRKASSEKLRSEPDLGKPAVRDRRGARGNVATRVGLRPTTKEVEACHRTLTCARPGSIPTREWGVEGLA